MTQKITAAGFHAIQTVLDWQPQRITGVWVDKSRHDARMTALLEQLERNGIAFQQTDKNTLDRLSKSSNHQGILAELNVASMRTDNDLLTDLDNNQKPPLLLVLDQVQDPHNFGACLRTADATGVDGVIIAKDNSVGFTTTVLKTSSGAFDFVPVYQVTNLRRTIKAIQDKGIWIVGASGDSKQSVYDADLTGGLAVVMGSESTGMRRLTREACDFLVNIPMLGRVESLNVSVATGVVLYEAVRQRQSAD
jgi:23S rRNA (guanosine2251-2'-O)-methyltransferase